MFTHLIVQPIFNLLVLIYAILPGHNFGLALIIFTVIVRLALWPLVKKQLHHAKVMRSMQPEIKKIKQATKGNRQKESLMLMELYKERGINPLATLPILIVQFIILIALYSGLLKIIRDPQSLVSFAYPVLQDLSWMKELAHNTHLFDNSLFGIVDLGKAALNKDGFYFPAFLIVLGSAVAQYYQAKQLMPDSDDQRGLRAILREAGQGKQADQSEVNAAVGRSTRYFIPVMIFIFTIGIASALSLYWLTGGLVAFIQQYIVLHRDETEMEKLGDNTSAKDVSKIPEAEVVAAPTKKPKANSNAARKAAKAKRRSKK